jgi:hypothetical protein
VDARLCGARAVFGHLVVELQALHLRHRGAGAGDAATAASTAALSLDPCAPLSTVTGPPPLRFPSASPPPVGGGAALAFQGKENEFQFSSNPCSVCPLK